METKKTKIRSFTDLTTWKEAHKLAISIYKLTEKFPKAERYGLIDQMKRSAVSVSSNIAEGFSRHSNLEKKHFYYQALGSLTELQNQLLLSKDIGYLNKNLFEQSASLTVSVSKLINSLIKFVKGTIPNT